MIKVTLELDGETVHEAKLLEGFKHPQLTGFKLFFLIEERHYIYIPDRRITSMVIQTLMAPTANFNEKF